MRVKEGEDGQPPAISGFGVAFRALNQLPARDDIADGKAIGKSVGDVVGRVGED